MGGGSESLLSPQGFDPLPNYGIRNTYGSEAFMESSEVLPMVQSNANVLVDYFGEESHEEAFRRISTVPG